MVKRRRLGKLPWHNGGHRKRVPLCDRKTGTGRFMEQVFGSGRILGIDRAADGSEYTVTLALNWTSPVYVSQRTLL